MRASDTPMDSVQTDSWYDNLPTDCREQGSMGRTPDQISPPNIWADCLELPALLNQVKDGVFDGGYAFVNTCLDPAGLAVTDPEGDADADGIPNKFDADLLLSEDGGA